MTVCGGGGIEAADIVTAAMPASGPRKHLGVMETPPCLLQVDAVGVVVGGHVGEDDFVAFFEAVEDFDGVHGGAAELHVDAHGFGAVFDDFEKRERGSSRGAFAGMDGAANVEDVI